MRILVIGGYGLIGLAIAKRLHQDGHDIVGLGRSKFKGEALLPTAKWIGADLSKLTTAELWLPHLENIDAVVNAAGVLQNGFKDNVIRVQQDSVLALVRACENGNVRKLVQISAPGVSVDSDTVFYQSKAQADAAIKQSSLNWTIFKPGLVISPHAYGGTSLLRSLAAFPLVQPLIFADKKIQTVAVSDVADAVLLAINENHSGQDYDLVESGTNTLEELILSVRSWLGFGEPLAVIRLPIFIGHLIARIANLAGWLGWRSALRTTSLKVLTNNVLGDSQQWTSNTGIKLKSLSESLSALPSTGQERVYARAKLVYPLLLLILALFWIVSGLIGIYQHDASVLVLDGKIDQTKASALVSLGSFTDIAIGAALLFRPFTRMACLASVLLCFGYLVCASIFIPELWGAPLGPLVKVFPAIALAIAVSFLSEDR